MKIFIRWKKQKGFLREPGALRGGFLIVLVILTIFACNLPGAQGVPTAEPTRPAGSPTETQPFTAPTDTVPTPAPTDTLAPEEAADIVFYNGTVLTMQPGVVTTAIAVKGDRILTLGNDERMLQLAGPETTVVDLQGRTLMPGFVDTHSHVFGAFEGDFQGAREFVLSNGITAMAEMGVHEDQLLTLQTMDMSGELDLRVSLYPVHIDNCGQVLGSWYLDAAPASTEPGAMLQVPGVKMFNDGGSCNAPAVSYEYPVGGMGDLYFTAEELAGHIAEAQSNGYQVAVHSLGDRAIDVTLDALALALDGMPNTYRHRIEHNAVLRGDQFARYSEVGPVATIFGTFPACLWAGDTSSFLYITPEEYRDWEWPWRPLIDTNPDLHVAWHSDYPVFGTLNPFEHLFGLVTRRQAAEDGSICDPPDWAADDALSVEEALRMMTIEAAYALHRDDELGSLAIGMLADLIVISANPLEVAPDDLPGIEVLMTMVGGRTVHCAEGAEFFCP